MYKIILYILCLFICAGLFFSCKTSNNVVSGGFLSKRKYNKGWYSDFKQIKPHAALPVKPGAEIPALPDEELKTEINSNEAEGLVSLQSDLSTTVLGKNKPHYSVTLPQSSYKPKITKTNTTKKQEEEQPEPEKKKTNPYALYSILSLLWTPVGASIVYLLEIIKVNGIFLGLFAVSAFIAPLASILLGFVAFKKKREHPSLYKNNGLAIPGIVLGAFLALANIAMTTYFLIEIDSLDAFILLLLGYTTTLAVVIGCLFYDTFLKKEKTIKPEPSDEEKEKIKRKLVKQNRFALSLLSFGLLLALVLLLFPMFFLHALPKNMDFYLFLFACLLFLTGTFKYISSLILKRKYKK